MEHQRTATGRASLIPPAVLVVALMLIPIGARASVEGPCQGSVTIDGIRYTPENDTPSNPIVIPNETGLVAEWEGSTATPITDHSGEVGIVIGPSTVVLEDWSGENAEEDTGAGGSYSVDDAKDFLPFELVGLYELSAIHSGEGGTCQGSAMLLIEGNPLTTPVGGAAVAGTLIAAVGVIAAGRRVA